MTADDLTINALARLQHDKDFMRVVSHLEACRAKQMASCMKERDEVLLRRAQGAAEELGEFIALCGHARTILELRQTEAKRVPQNESYT